MRRLARLTIGEIAANYPVWFVVCVSAGHVLSAIWLGRPPRPASILTFGFPLFWFAAYYGVARQGRPRVAWSDVVSLLLGGGALTLALWVPVRLFWNASDPAALRFGYEVL